MASKFFVGSGTSVWSWDSDTGLWTDTGYAGGRQIVSIGGTEPTDVWAGTYTAAGKPVLHHYDGALWTAYELSLEIVAEWTIGDIHVVSSTEAYAVAHCWSFALWEHRIVLWGWDGVSWTQITNWVSLPWPTAGVWSAAPDNIYLNDKSQPGAIGYDIAHWNGAGIEQDDLTYEAIGWSVRGYSSSEVIVCQWAEDEPDKLFFYRGSWATGWAPFNVTADNPGGLATTLQLTASTIWSLIWKAGNDRYLRMFDRATLVATEELVGTANTTYGMSVISDGQYICVVGDVGTRMRIDGAWSTHDPAGGILYSVWGWSPPLPTPVPYNKNNTVNVVRAMIEAIGEEM